MKFIHTADLHLASPFQGLTNMPAQLWKQIYNSTFTAFKKIVDAAISHQVDFVLIVGDIYDGERKSIAAVNFFQEQMDRLAHQQIPVFLCYGNHDYQANPAKAQNLPANVHVFGNQVSTDRLTLTDGTTVAVTGFSYGEQWIDRDMVADYPVKGTVNWQIGMLHGALRQSGNGDHYAPFTLDELKGKHYDYWALGHIHKHQVLVSNPPIVYSGNPQGRHKNEAGDHGYYLVESEGQQLVPHFQKLSEISWQSVPVDLSSCNDEKEIYRTVEKSIIGDHHQLQLVEVRVTAAGAKWSPLIQNGSLLNYLQDQANKQSVIKWWPYQVSLISNNDLPELASLDQTYWQQAEKEVFTRENLRRVTEPLTKRAVLLSLVNAHQDPAEYQRLARQLLGERGDDSEN